MVEGRVKKPEMNCKPPSNQFHLFCVNNSWMNQQGIVSHVSVVRQVARHICASVQGYLQVDLHNDSEVYVYTIVFNIW
jgi:hypothetical protein